LSRFTARAAAVSLSSIVFAKIDESKKAALIAMLSKLSEDEAPAVRRGVAKSLSSILVKSSSGSYKDLVELFQRLAKDDQDSIRIQIIPAAITFVEVLPWDLKVNFIVPTLVSLASDKSWRVRWSLSHHVKAIFSAFPNDNATKPGGAATLFTLSTMFDGLLNDPEPEVRAAAGEYLSAICAFLPRTTICSTILPTVQRLATDNSEFVKAVVSGEISMLSPLLGKEDTIRLLLPLLLTLLRDDTSDVRLNVISQLHGINSTIGVDLLAQSLLPAIIGLAQDNKWRVRLAVIELMPMIGKQLGVKIFTDNLASICIGWLHDNVHAIRKAAAINIQRLAQLFGEDWAYAQIIPQVHSMARHSHYLQRVTSLYAGQVLIDIFPKNVELSRSLSKLFCSLQSDAVANVRLTLAKVLLAPLKSLSATDPSRAEIVSVLDNLSNDTDRDVRFYAVEVR
jgi:serine/threonine-protein phosphatase 2A regulatory subunit A